MLKVRRCLRAALLVVALTLLTIPAGAQAKRQAKAAQAPVPELSWTDCGGGLQCANASVPLDYSRPNGLTYRVALIRKPATDTANRIGSLFTNPGGPGASGVDFVRATADSLYATLNQRYDIVGFDPRGTGASQAPIDCHADQETEGIYGQPFTTPDNVDFWGLVSQKWGYVQKCKRNNPQILPYVTTGNVARDLDLLRRAVGDDQLNYLGFSYGTFLGATYASLFPGKLGRVVLDGPVDADEYINHPLADLSAQTAGFETALGRFFQACARDQTTCLGFGGDDPWSAFDALADQMDVTSLPAAGYTPDPRPVDGDDLRAAAILVVYNKGNWPFFAQLLASAAAGDGTLVRYVTDLFYGRNDDGTFAPDNDRYFTIGAVEQRYTSNLLRYFRAGKRSWSEHEHFWFNNGYAELPYGLYGVRPNGAFDGPFRIPASANTPLVVATTYDPATPYRGARNLVRDLGNARLLTMNGDGHTAYGGNSPCIDSAVEAYLLAGTLPAAGTRCQQDVPFVQEPTAGQRRAPLAPQRNLDELLSVHVKPVVPLRAP